MLDIQAEQYDAGQSYPDLYEAVVGLKRRHDLHPCSVGPRDGFALRRDGERELVQDLVRRFRQVPDEHRQRLPALLNSLAQLEVVVGDLESGQVHFQEVARLVHDPISQAEAHHNVYRTALERGDREAALTSLRRAVALDPDVFEPFPFGRYEPLRILRADGCGVSFLCEERPMEGEDPWPHPPGPEPSGQNLRIVRALRPDSLEREIDTLFAEIHTLHTFDHPALIRVFACAFAGHDHAAALFGLPGPAEGRPGPVPGAVRRPYLVTEYFDGLALDTFVGRHGAFAPEDWLPVAWALARALQGLHQRGVLHRSLSPSCVLVRRDREPDGTVRHRVKLLDVGLSLKRALIHVASCNSAARTRTVLGRSVSRLLPYTPSEAIARPRGLVWVGPHSDVYGFGRLSALALTGRPDPDAGDKVLLSEDWRALLDDCCAWVLSQRPAHFGLVLERLARLAGPGDPVTHLEAPLYDDIVRSCTAVLGGPDGREERVEVLTRRGLAFAHQGNFSQAIADFSEALRLRPGHPALLRHRALAHWRNFQLPEAVTDYTQAIAADPHDAESHANRALVHAQLEQHDRAIADFSTALTLVPRDATLLFNRGNSHFARGDLDRALADYSESIALNPNNVWALSQRGQVHLRKGEFGKAVSDFTRVLHLDPENRDALIDRASALVRLGGHDRALGDYGRAIALDPTATLYLDRGLTHVILGNTDPALADFTAALERDPELVVALVYRGKTLLDANRLDEALADFDEALTRTPSSADLLCDRAKIYARRGDRDRALADYGRALELAPEHLGTLLGRAALHAASGAAEQALADYSTALRIDPDNAEARRRRARLYADRGDDDQALADYDRALSEVRDDAGLWAERGTVRARLGDLDGALADHARAVELDPANGEVLTARAMLRVQQGEVDAALADLDRAIDLAPRLARAYFHRGTLHADQGDWERALTDLTAALVRDPDLVAAYLNRSTLYLQAGAAREALPDCEEVLRRHPGHAGALNNRGSARHLLGEREQALADFTAAIEADPASALAFSNRAVLRQELGDHEGAFRDFTRALELAPDEVTSYHNRGRALADRGDWGGAIADHEEALRRVPDDARTWNNLAWLCASAPDPTHRNPDRAIECATRACELTDWEDPVLLDTLATACAAAGRYAEAVRHQRRALELAPGEYRDQMEARLGNYERKQEEEV